MRVPQVNERVKEAPAHALRAMFAGIGQLLSVTDKIRNKPAAPAPAEAEDIAHETVTPEPVAAEAAAPETAATETVAPEPVAPDTAAPETVATETVAPEPVAPETGAPEAAATGAPEAKPAAPATPDGHVRLLPADKAPAAPAAPAPAAPAGGGLPLPNYDDLSIASLRARLRNLSAEQLGQLIEYEKAHAARADVIAMFERRLAKLAEG